ASKALSPCSETGSGPAADGLATDLNPSPHFTLVVSLLQQFQRRKPSPFQRLKIALHATRIAHTTETIGAAYWLRYIMRDSIIRTSCILGCSFPSFRSATRSARGWLWRRFRT